MSGIESRIVGGIDAAPHSAPYIASIRILFQGQIRHSCGGVILDEWNILTAAHCMSSFETFVSIGSHYLEEIIPGETFHNVSARYAHPQYPGNFVAAPYDFAIYVLETPIVFSDTVRPIKLPEADSSVSGNVTLFGWGNISDNGTFVFPDSLQTANLHVIDMPDCLALERMQGLPVDPDANLCTGPLDAGLAACNADSGGPLIQGPFGNEVVVGIVSWGLGPCGRGPDVHGKVSSVIQWIEQTLFVPE